MSAFVQYGAFSHRPGDVDVSQSIEVLENDARQPYEKIERWVLDVRLGTQAANAPADIDAKFAALKAAYSVSGQDVKLLMPDGSTASNLKMISSQAIGGVRVVKPPEVVTLQQAGYVTNLICRIELEGRFVVNSSILFKSFTEELIFEGGGSIEGYLYPHVGTPVRQQFRARDTFRCQQIGSAVGLYARPPIAFPIFLGAQLRSPRRTLRSPQSFDGGARRDFFVSWQYDYESTTPLIGTPTVWNP